jgi:hypothetical protein
MRHARRLGIELAARENAPRTIIKNHADVHLFSIVIAGMPIQAFVSNPGFSALRFVAVHIGQAIMQQHLMNGIMRDMLSMLELDDLFQSSCAQILLFVDASTASKLSLISISETSSISFSIQGLFLSSKFPNV